MVCYKPAYTLSHYDSIISTTEYYTVYYHAYMSPIYNVHVFFRHIISSDVVVLNDDLLYISCAIFNSKASS